VAIDRAATFKNAEKLLRQGRPDLAIAEYFRIVNEDPRDWNSANILGDLYVRAGSIDKAVEQFVRIADGLGADGFLSKAGALYKKVLKIRPDHEHALLQGAEIAASQGLLADARRYLNAVLERRLENGDVGGVAEIRVRLGSLDPDDRSARRSSDLSSGLDDLRGSARPDAPPLAASGRSESVDVDLSIVLDDSAMPVAPAPAPRPPAELDDVFAQFRDDVSRKAALDAASKEYERGRRLYEAGEIDACIPALESASRAPRLRFVAAALLGRITRRRGIIPQAIDWFERAAQAPAPSVEEGQQLLYELADALESVGEIARALAIFLELRADAGDYRDVSSRIDRLSKAQARG
jgi:tetratricopeptide (TPR) repeat protein